MTRSSTITIHLDPDLAAPLLEAAKAQGWTPESLVAECVVQHLETAIRHRVLIERLELMDANLTMLAEFIGEATAGSDDVDLSSICRFRSDACL